MQSEFNFGHPGCKKKYPDPSEIKPRGFDNLEDDLEIRAALKINKKRKITVLMLQKMIKSVQGSLNNKIERYNDIRKNGDAAMSRYDILMGYTAQNSGLPLIHNHIGYYKGQLCILEYWMAKISPVKGSVNKHVQLELF